MPNSSPAVSLLLLLVLAVSACSDYSDWQFSGLAYDVETASFTGVDPTEPVNVPSTGSADYSGQYRAYETRYFSAIHLGNGDASMVVDFASDSVVLSLENGPVSQTASGTIDREYDFVESDRVNNLNYFAEFFGPDAEYVAGDFNYTGHPDYWITGQFILER